MKLQLRSILSLVSFLTVSSHGLAIGQVSPGGTLSSNGEPLDRTPSAVRLPFEFDPISAPMIVVRASINGSRPLRLIFDTGLNKDLLLDEWAAAELKLEASRPSREDQKRTKQFKDGPEVSLKLLAGGVGRDVKIKTAIPTVVGRLPDLNYFGQRDIAGIIGLPFISEWAVRLDFQEGTLTILSGPQPSTEKLGSARLPLSRSERGFLVPVRFGGEQESYLLLDTGSNLTHVPAAISDQVPAASRRLTASADIRGNFHIATSVLSQTLKLGTLTERDIPLMPCTSEGPAVLGTDVLRRFLVTIDCRSNRLILDRTTSSPGSAGIEGDTGIALQQDDNGFFASRVKANSVASSAGIRIGDRILEVEGRPLRLVTWAAAQSMVDGIAGRPQRLVVGNRQNDRRQVSVTPRNSYRNAKSAILGFTLEWSAEGLRVEEVVPTSVAYRKGLRTGDVIRKVNDLAVAGATIQDVFAELSLAKVRLEKIAASGGSLVVELAAE